MTDTHSKQLRDQRTKLTLEAARRRRELQRAYPIGQQVQMPVEGVANGGRETLSMLTGYIMAHTPNSHGLAAQVRWDNGAIGSVDLPDQRLQRV